VVVVVVGGGRWYQGDYPQDPLSHSMLSMSLDNVKDDELDLSLTIKVG